MFFVLFRLETPKIRRACRSIGVVISDISIYLGPLRSFSTFEPFDWLKVSVCGIQIQIFAPAGLANQTRNEKELAFCVCTVIESIVMDHGTGKHHEQQ
jgi:hypothetical protein